MPIVLLPGDWKIAHESNRFYTVVESFLTIKFLLRPGLEEVMALKKSKENSLPISLINSIM